MKAVIITSNQLRHKYYCSKIAEKMALAGIVAEGKSAAVSDFSKELTEDQQVMQKHLAERDEVEVELLGADNEFPDVPLLSIPNSESNSQETFEWIKALEPDIILLYGSSIIKDPILSHYNNRIINLHLGLSPYYRGSGTNFWPLVYKQPECVGGTIHLAVRKVDAGSILHQFRPEVFEGDRAHHLGTRTIMKGAELVPDVAMAYLQGDIQPQSQDLGEGKVFYTRDYSAGSVRELWQNLDDNMIGAYVQNREERCKVFPIVENL